MLKNILIIICVVIASLTVNPVWALKSDVEKPVYINADTVLFDKSKGKAVYDGNVSIIQGTLEIKANKIEIQAPNNEIIKILASGTPVSFKQRMDNGKLAQGGANELVYFIKNKRLILNGNASLSQDKDKFTSNRIEYSTQSGELKAGRTNGKNKGRVNAIFYPSNKAK